MTNSRTVARGPAFEKHWSRPYTRADKPIARVSKLSRGKISLARDIHFSPKSFISFAQPASLYCEEYVYIHTYLTA